MSLVRNPKNLRHIIFCTLVAEQNLVLQDINFNSNPPGLKPEQSRFLKLVETITSGTKIMVTKGGTHMKFYAGMVNNCDGVDLQFECGLQRGIGYYLEYLILIAMFGKVSLNITLKGLTNTNLDNSVDSLANHIIPLLKQHYGFDNELSIKILKRGYLPEGGGVVQVCIPTIRRLNRVNLQEKGYIKRVRGICAGSRIATSIMNQVKDQVKKAFLNYLPDVWIYTDYYKGDKASKSPGYSLCLKAETTTGSIITFESTQESQSTSEFANKCLNSFISQLKFSGAISTNYQWFLLTLMALSEKRTSSVKLGRISPYTVECLRIFRDFFGIIFEIQESESEGLAVFRVLGIGYENYARVVN